MSLVKCEKCGAEIADGAECRRCAPGSDVDATESPAGPLRESIDGGGNASPSDIDAELEAEDDSHETVGTIVLLALLALGWAGYNLATGAWRFSDTALERALVVGKSTPRDLQHFKDEGGLNNRQERLWNDLSPSDLGVEYDKSTELLSGFYLSFSRHEASPNQLKKLLSDTCRAGWTMTQTDIYESEGAQISCLIGARGEDLAVYVTRK